MSSEALQAAAAPAPRSRPWRWLGFALFVVVTAALVHAMGTIDWRRSVTLLATASPMWIIAALAGNVAIIVSCTAFWQSILPRTETRIAFARMFEIVAVSTSLMNTLPFGGGHASSVVLLIRRGGASQRGALSLLALTQLGEGVSKMLLFLIVAALAPLPDGMRTAVVSVALGVAALFAVMMIASRWARELAILKHVGRSTAALGWVLMTKVVQAVAIFAVQRAFGVDVSMSGTLLVLAAIVLGTMLPLAPGNLGTFEASAFVAYRSLGIAPEQALGMSIMQHVCFMIPSVGIGYLYLSAHTLTRSAIASR